MSVLDIAIQPRQIGRRVVDPTFVEVRFSPPNDRPLRTACKDAVALFESQYQLFEDSGEKVFPVYSANGLLMYECALFIKQRPGGREVPKIDAGKYIGAAS